MMDALLDGIPIVVICGQVATSVQGTAAFQEIDVIPLAKPCTKWCTCVDSIATLPAAIDSAFAYAMDKRPGPVLVAIPKDVGSATFDDKALEESFKVLDASCILRESYSSLTHYIVDIHDQVDRIANIINRSKRPVICAGNGVHNSENGSALLMQVAERAGIPVTTTLLGLGSFDETHDLALHMLGTHGTPYANYTVQNADLLIAVGARLDERAVGKAAAFAPKTRDIIQIDISADTVGKVIKPTELVIGDLSVTLRILLPQLERHHRKDWLAQVQHWKTEHALHKPTIEEHGRYALPQQIMAELDRQTETIKHRTTIATGVGNHQLWAAQRYTWRYSRSLITSGGLGTMGYGLPAAIGAQVVKPDHVVLDVEGDSSLCMTMEELLTASQYHIPVKVIVFNDSQQGMISQAQRSEYNGRECYSRQENPDFVKLAESMGCQARQCPSAVKLSGCIKWLLDSLGPALLDVVIEETELKPIVPGGEALEGIKLG
jgi:acetolactate synthase-1/2/3 large subunit